MSAQTKSKFKVWAKRVGALVFAVLFLLNIKIIFSDENTNSDISLLSIELELFQGTYAQEANGTSGTHYQITDRRRYLSGLGWSYYFNCFADYTHNYNCDRGGWGFPRR